MTDVSPLRSFPKLRHLMLNETLITDLEPLRLLPQLHKLTLPNGIELGGDTPNPENQKEVQDWIASNI